MPTEECANVVSRQLQAGDADYGVRALAEIAAGKTRGVSADDVLAALPQLDGVGVEWTPVDSLVRARMYHDGEGYVLDEWPLPLGDDWDADCLSRHEAGALLEEMALLEVKEMGR